MALALFRRLVSPSVSYFTDQLTDQVFQSVDTLVSLLQGSGIVLLLEASELRCVLQVPDKRHGLIILWNLFATITSTPTTHFWFLLQVPKLTSNSRIESTT